MENYRVIICDDNHSKYEIINQAFIDNGWVFELYSSIHELEVAIQNQRNVIAVFLDLYYKSSDSEEEAPKPINYNDVLNIRSKLKYTIPLFIYTSYTKDELVLLQELSQQRIIDDWLDEAEFHGTKEQIARVKGRIIAKIKLDFEIHEGLWIAHFSDLHFGKQYDYAGSSVKHHLVRLISNQIKSAVSDNGALGIKQPSISIFSGDISNSANVKEFDDFKDFHERYIKFLKEVGLNKNLSILAPGNHDFDLRTSILEEKLIEYNKKKKDFDIVDNNKNVDLNIEYYRKLKWNNYLDLDEESYSPVLRKSNPPIWWIYDLSKSLGINFFVLNSSYFITYKDKAVKLLGSQVEEIISNSNVGTKLGILVIHHPCSSWPEEEKDQIINLLYDALNIKLIFSGHKHNPKIVTHRIDGGRQIVEIQTGSLAVKETNLPTFIPPNFRIVQLTANNLKDWEFIRSWSFGFNGTEYSVQPIANTSKYFDEEQLK